MELLSSESHYIVVDGNHSLWINRKNGTFTAKTGDNDEMKAGSKTTCLGLVYGLIGKLHYSESSEPRLVFIQKHSKVAQIQGHDLFQIRSIVTIPLESEAEVFLEPCTKSHKTNAPTIGFSKSKAFTPLVPSSGATANVTNNSSGTTASLQKVKCPASGSFKYLNFTSLPKRNEKSGSDKIEKRMLDEFHKMFTEAESFFFSTTYDITNTVQRHIVASEKQPKGTEVPVWKQADSRFFWNIHLMNDLINSKDPSMDRWILPIIQGFIQHEVCDVSQFEMLGPEMSGHIELCVISRRSRFRPGTRYLRRGVDENGKVANYVETEQILMFKGHIISFVQIRGSIPVFWSQLGYKYRPPPRLERTEEENINAFTKHFDEEEAIYGSVTVINLVEKSGKEKVLGDAYLDNVIKYNSSNINYFAYDFHESCGGMRFENVSILIDKLSTVLKSMNYCWVDSYGMVLRQEGICRVNCVDCLDRTNVVETHVAKYMLVVQLSKLGLLVPDISLPNNVRQKLQVLWANNGDTISKQYAGTNALKGDFTRTGERRFAGVMKDGMNSANRYYLNRFKDTSRQAAIDLILGVKTNITEEDLDGERAISDEKENTAEQIKQVIDDVKKCIIPTFDVVLGSWGFVNTKNNDLESMDIDTIFILTDNHYYVTEYDCMLDALTETQKVSLTAIDSIEIGCESLNQPSNLWSIFQSSSSGPKGIPNIRLNYEHCGQMLYHQFRSSNVRFFNNVIISINHSPDEMLESLKMFAEALEAAVSIAGKKIAVHEMAILPVKEPPRGNSIPAMASSWVHRYFSFGNEADANEKPASAVEILGNLQEKSSSKFYRRASLISTPSQADSEIESVSESNQVDKKKNKGDGDEINISDLMGLEESFEKPLSVDEIDLQLTITKSSQEKITKKSSATIIARTPVEGYSSFLVPTKDLVLSSCGILSIHESNFTSSLSTLLSAHELIMDMDGLASPATPIVPSFPLEFANPGTTLTENILPLSFDNHKVVSVLSPNLRSDIKGESILHKHRHSLPVNSLGINPRCINSLNRPVTPEIRITEEPSNIEEGGRIETVVSPTASLINNLPTAKLSIIPKRMTRSSEDVNTMSRPSINASVVSKLTTKFGGGSLKFGRLPATISNENRSSSDLDIFNSVVSMKGSHSDNTLRENPFDNQGSNKKDLVFSPLGKLARGMQNIGANYLDPRKLKGSFKQPRMDSMRIIGNKKDERSKDDINALQERIKNCKSVIIDI